MCGFHTCTHTCAISERKGAENYKKNNKKSYREIQLHGIVEMMRANCAINGDEIFLNRDILQCAIFSLFRYVVINIGFWEASVVSAGKECDSVSILSSLYSGVTCVPVHVLCA